MGYYKNNENEKFCPKCGKFLDRNEFGVSKCRYDGCYAYCKKCRNLISIERGIVRPFKCIKNSNGVKWCPKCKKIKEYSLFNKCSARKDGLNDWCKKCLSDHQRLKRQKGPIEREIKYRNSEKGRKTAKKATDKYRNSEKYKIWCKKYYNRNKLSNTISTRIRQSLKGCKYGRHWETLVDYTLEDLKLHIEKQFESGMNWNNYGIKGWHIDHIRPVVSFNIIDYKCEDFKECWLLSNLQPLWWKDNLEKGAKWKGVDYKYET